MNIREYVIEQFLNSLDEVSIEAYKAAITGGKKLPALVKAVPQGVQTGVLKGTNVAKKVGVTSGASEIASGMRLPGVHTAPVM